MGAQASSLADDFRAWRSGQAKDSRLLASGELRVLFVDGCSSGGTAQVGPFTEALGQIRRLASDAGLSLSIFEPEPATGPTGRDCHVNEQDMGLVRRALLEAMEADFIVCVIPENGLNWREMDVSGIALADRVAFEFPFLQTAKERTLSEWCLRAALLRAADRKAKNAFVAVMGGGGPPPARATAFGFDIASLGISSKPPLPPTAPIGDHFLAELKSAGFRLDRFNTLADVARALVSAGADTLQREIPPAARAGPPAGATSLGRLHQANTGAAVAALARPLVGREEVVARLDAYAASAAGHEAPLVLVAGPGAGKTAVTAHWAARFATLHPTDVLVSFHARCCRDGGSLSSALRYLGAELEARLHWPLRDVPVADPRAAGRAPPAPFVGALDSDEEVIRAFPAILVRAALAAQINSPPSAPPRRVLLVVDGIDQFGGEGLFAASAREGDEARQEAAAAVARFVDQLQWLPHPAFAPDKTKRLPVPPNLRVVLTCSPEFAEASLGPLGIRPLELAALPPALLQEALLKSQGAVTMLRSRPDLARRLAQAPLASSPLFLALADRRLALAEMEKDAEEGATRLAEARTLAEAADALIARLAAGPPPPPPPGSRSPRSAAPVAETPEAAARRAAMRSLLGRLLPALRAARFGLTEAECVAVAGLASRPHEWLEVRQALDGAIVARHAGLVRLASPTIAYFVEHGYGLHADARSPAFDSYARAASGRRLVEDTPTEGVFRRIAALCTPPPDPPVRSLRDLSASRRALPRVAPFASRAEAEAALADMFCSLHTDPARAFQEAPWLMLRGGTGPGGAELAPERVDKIVALLTDPDVFLFAAQNDFPTLLRYWRSLVPGPRVGGEVPAAGRPAREVPLDPVARAYEPRLRALFAQPAAPGSAPGPARQVALGLALSAVGDLQRCLGFHEAALDHYRHGVEACGGQPGEAQAMTGRLLLAMGETLTALWDRDVPARELPGPANGCCAPSLVPPSDRPASPTTPRVEDPLPVLVRALQALDAAGAPAGFHAARACGALGALQLERGAPERALPLLARALDAARELFGPAHPAAAQAELAMALALASTRGPEAGRAVSHAAGACESLRRARGDDDPAVWAATEALAKVHLAARSYPPALELLSGLLSKRRRELGQGSEPAARAAMSLAAAQVECGALKDAVRSASEALAAYRKLFGEGDTRTLEARSAVAGTLRALGDLPESREEYEKVAVALREKLGAQHPQAARAQADLAAVLLRLNKDEEALAAYRAAQGPLERAVGETSEAHVACVEGIAQCHEKGRRMGEALSWWERALRLRTAAGQAPQALLTGANLADVLLRHRAPAPPNAADLHRALELYSQVLQGANRGELPTAGHEAVLRSVASRLENVKGQLARLAAGATPALPPPGTPADPRALDYSRASASSLNFSGIFGRLSTGESLLPPATPAHRSAPGTPLLPPRYPDRDSYAPVAPPPVGRYAPEPM